jgi:hypothetical protein
MQALLQPEMKSHRANYKIALAMNLAIAAGMYFVPGALGFGWNSTPGPSLLNTRDASDRYPAINITAEPWGASVVLTPSESRLREFIADGYIPLWNPYQGMGEPYAAQGDGSPYAPWTIIRAFAPPSLGNLTTFVSFAIGAAATYGFLGLLGLSKEVRLIGMIAFFLSTANTFHIARYNIGDQNALIPVQFLAVTFAVLRRSPLAYLILACCSAVTMTAGFVPSAIVTIIVATAFAGFLAYIRYDSPHDRLICSLGVASATLVGLTLAAPFWLPIAEISQVAYHKNVPSVVMYTPPNYNFIAFFFPGLFGNSLGRDLGAVVDWSNLFATCSIGVTLLCAIGLIACKWTHREHQLIFRFAIVFAILIAFRFMNWPPFSWLATHAPVSQPATKHTQAAAAFLLLLSSTLVLEQIKNWSFQRVQWLFFLFGAIFVAIVLSTDLSAERAEGLANFIHPYSILIVATLFCCSLLIARYGAQIPAKSELILIFAGAAICAELSLYLPLGNDDQFVSFVRVAIGVTWVIACFANYFDRKTIFTIAIVGITLAYSAIIFFPTQGLPKQVSDRHLPSFADFLKHRVGNDYRTFGIFPNYSSQVGVQDLGTVGPFNTSGLAAFVHSIDPAGELDFYRSTVFLLGGMDANRYLRYRSLFDWIGVRYIVVERAVLFREFQDHLLSEQPDSFRQVYSDDKVVVIESLSAKPRFEFSSSVRLFTSQFAIIRELQSNPTIVAHSVLLESSANDTVLETLVKPEPIASVEVKIELMENTPNGLQLRLTNTQAGLLVIKDAYFSGWKAYLDGQRMPILRVNGMVQGLEVASPGTHVVKLYYEPFGFGLGVLGGSAAFLAFCAILIVCGRRLSPRLETGIVCCGMACLTFIVTAIFLVTMVNHEYVKLGSENVSAINLTDTELKWRETDSTDGRELFTRGIKSSRLPIATDGQNNVPLHIGDLVYVPNIGLAEIDMRGHFRPVSANDGAIITVCSAFAAPGTQSKQAAQYTNGVWQITSLPETSKSSSCHPKWAGLLDLHSF